MPLLTDASNPADWIEPDDVPRPVVTYGIASGTIGEFELAPHEHRKSQILFVQRGALSCEVEGACGSYRRAARYGYPAGRGTRSG